MTEVLFSSTMQSTPLSSLSLSQHRSFASPSGTPQEVAHLFGRDVFEFLRKATRECLFDFDKVAAAVKNYCVVTKQDPILLDLVNPELCREFFANDYYSESTPSDLRPFESAKPLAPLENMTFDEMMGVIAQMEEENNRKKERIFSRVLASLQGDGASSQNSSAVMAVDAEMSLFLNNVEEMRQVRELERQRQLNQQEEVAERRRLEAEREKLKKRFDAGSDDSVGIDPFHPMHRPKKSTYFDDILPDVPVNVDHFNIEEVLDNKEFDMILESIEEELRLEAPTKSGEYTMSSDLQELFQLLDSEAATSNGGSGKIKKHLVPASKSYIRMEKVEPGATIVEGNGEMDATLVPEADSKPAKLASVTQVPMSTASVPPVMSEDKPAQSPRPTQQQAPAAAGNKGVKSSRTQDFAASSLSDAVDDMSLSADNDNDDDYYASNWRTSRQNLKHRASVVTTVKSSNEEDNQLQCDYIKQSGSAVAVAAELKRSVWKAYGGPSTNFSSLLRKKSALEELEAAAAPSVFQHQQPSSMVELDVAAVELELDPAESEGAASASVEIEISAGDIVEAVSNAEPTAMGSDEYIPDESPKTTLFDKSLRKVVLNTVNDPDEDDEEVWQPLVPVEPPVLTTVEALVQEAAQLHSAVATGGLGGGDDNTILSGSMVRKRVRK